MLRRQIISEFEMKYEGLTLTVVQRCTFNLKGGRSFSWS